MGGNGIGKNKNFEIEEIAWHTGYEVRKTCASFPKKIYQHVVVHGERTS